MEDEGWGKKYCDWQHMEKESEFMQLVWKKAATLVRMGIGRSCLRERQSWRRGQMKRSEMERQGQSTLETQKTHGHKFLYPLKYIPHKALNRKSRISSTLTYVWSPPVNYSSSKTLESAENLLLLTITLLVHRKSGQEIQNFRLRMNNCTSTMY